MLLHVDDIATLVMQPISLTAFDNKSNVNVARNQYDPTGNPWFGKSLNSVDYPDWGHPHQVTNFNAISGWQKCPTVRWKVLYARKCPSYPPKAACTHKNMLAHVH